jgi:hypothetical protein
MWVAFLVPAAAVLLSLMETEDLAYQIRAGSLMWHAHALLRTDPFTFTVGGAPWHDLQWGAQLVLTAVYAAGGWRGLVVLRAVIVGGAVGVTYLRTTRRGASAQASIVATFAAFVVCASLSGSIAMRPQLLAVPFFIATAVVLSVRSRHPGWVWVIPVLGVVWVNLHGSFVLVGVLTGIAFVSDVIDRMPRRRTTGVVFVASVAAPLVNPWGYRSYTYIVDLATTPIVRTVIDEWRPMWRQWPAGLLFALAVGGIVIVLVRGGWGRIGTEDRLVILTFTLLALASGRNVVWWSLAVPPAIAAALPSRGSTWSRPASMIARAGVAGVLAIALARFASEPPEEVLADAPAGISDTVSRAASPGAHVFAGWWGSWLEFTDPAVRQFVDARAEMFPSDVWADYFVVSRAEPGWSRVLDRRGIDIVVASRQHQAPLMAALETDAGWRELFADQDGAVFGRVAASP